MFYSLDDNYYLRGWRLLPYAVVDSKKHTACFVDKKTFDVLSLCNGKVDFSLPIVQQNYRDIAKKLEDAGFIRACAEGETILPKQEYHFYDNRFMRNVHWSITGRCNYKCRHCFLSAPDARFGELSHEDVMKIIDGLGECGVLRCSITGGEPLIRPDFWEIVDALIKNDILISTVYTNGFLLRDDILEGFEERGLRPEFNMSFDGIGCHDWMRGIDGAETAVRRAFELCKDRGFPTGAEMCLWKENAHTLSDSINYLASVGCRSIKVNPVGNTGAWLEGGYAEGHSLSTEETFELYYNYLDDFYRDLPQMNVHLGGFFMGDGRDPDKYNLPAVHASKDPGKNCICGHARNTIYISPEGRALTCMAVSSDEDFSKEYPLIQEYGVKECLDSSKYMELINTRSETVLAHNERCRDCSYKDMCLGGCRAAGLLSHPGDILGIDEGTCLYFREGWKDKIIEKISKLRPEADRV